MATRQNKYDHLEPDLHKWPIHRFSEARLQFIQELTKLTVA